MAKAVGLQKFVVLATIAHIQVGCQSAELSLTSNPSGASVSVFNPATSQFESRGQTPIEIGQDQLMQYAPDAATFSLVLVEHPNHITERVFVDRSGNPLQKIHINLKAQAGAASDETVNDVATALQSINRDVQEKNYSAAQLGIEKLTQRFPKAHLFWDIAGSIYYLMGDESKAVTAYQNSLRLNPENAETKAVLKSLGRL